MQQFEDKLDAASLLNLKFSKTMKQQALWKRKKDVAVQKNIV